MGWNYKKYPYFDDKEVYRSFDYHRDEMKKYEEQLDRFQRANEYLHDRENYRDGYVDPKTDEWVEHPEGKFSGHPSGWFKGKK